MKGKINNLAELKEELVQLNRLKKEQETYLGDQYALLKNKIETPSRIFSAITSSVPGVGVIKNLFSSFSSSQKSNDENSSNKSDWLTKTSRIALPFILNKTLLKNSGWLKKALVLLASESAVGQINKDKVSTIVGKVANFIRPDKSKKKHKKTKPLDDQFDTREYGVSSSDVEENFKF